MLKRVYDETGNYCELYTSNEVVERNGERLVRCNFAEYKADGTMISSGSGFCKAEEDE